MKSEADRPETLTIEAERCRIDIRISTLGHDLVFTLTGGAAHVGAVATAYWQGNTVRVHLEAVPGHREGPLAEQMARFAALILRRTIVVIMGIHLDEATPAEIEWISDNVKQGMKQLIMKWSEPHNG